jgi:hypothetical protein
MGTEPFNQKDRGSRHWEKVIRAFSHAGQPMPICSFHASRRTHFGNMGRALKPDRRVCEWKPLSFVSTPILDSRSVHHPIANRLPLRQNRAREIRSARLNSE